MRSILDKLFAAALLAAPAVAQVSEQPDLIYATLSTTRQLRLDLYLPDPAARPAPCVVWIHGGGWAVGSRTSARNDARALAQRGFAVAAVEYRLSREAKWPAQMHDVKGAVRWLRANAARFGLDPDRFASFGGSAGGHLAAVLGTSAGSRFLEGDVGGNLDRSSRVQATADFFGPTDFFAAGASHLEPTSRESQLIGRPIGQILANRNDPAWAPWVYLVEQANPITHVSSDDPPFWIAHATNDPVVEYSQSILLRDALLAAGRPVVLRTTTSGHSMPQSEFDARADWLEDQLLRPQPHRTYGAACGTPGQDRPGAGWIDVATPGGRFALTLERGLPNSPVALLFGLGRADVPLATAGAPGCSLFVAAPVDLALTADGAGRAQAFVDVPLGVPAGLEAFSQWVVLDASANALGATTTNGLTTRVQ